MTRGRTRLKMLGGWFKEWLESGEDWSRTSLMMEASRSTYENNRGYASLQNPQRKIRSQDSRFHPYQEIRTGEAPQPAYRSETILSRAPGDRRQGALKQHNMSDFDSSSHEAHIWPMEPANFYLLNMIYIYIDILYIYAYIHTYNSRPS